MARRKEEPRPLLAFKHDFYASLDNMLHEATMLIQATEMVIRTEAVKGPAADALKERIAAFRKSIFTEE